MTAASSVDISPNAMAGKSEDRWEPQSPFIDHLSLSRTRTAQPPAREGGNAASPYQTESPFLSVYETGIEQETFSPRIAELFGVLAELRDREFDDAVYQLQSEVYDLLTPRVEAEEDLSNYEVERFFEAHFGPLVRETNLLLDEMAAEMEHRDVTGLTELEIDDLLARFEPEETGLAPSFEGFLKKIWKKAKKTVKKVVAAAKKGVVKAVKTVGKIASAPVTLVLNKLKKLVKPLLEKVLKSAIGKLPEPLQDAAKQAAQKLFGKGSMKNVSPEESELYEFEMEVEALVNGGSEAAAEEVHYIQQEFDLQIANLVLAEDETQQDLAIADYEKRSRRSGLDPRVRLRRARRRLARELQVLGDGDDAAPVVEQFIPAILPVLKLGLKVIGRQRVIETISKLIGNLLRPFVGPKMTKPLADAIVGAGFRLVGLEMTEDDKADAAAQTTASVVEDTVRRVVQLPSELLDDEVFLEAYVEEAFDYALSQNFPPMPRRPELMTSELPGGWETLAEYKRFNPQTPVVVTISQAMTTQLKTFGGTVPTVLGHSLTGLVGEKATVRVYEAIPGTWLSKISRDEKNVRGLGGTDEVQWRSIHPLTTAAAAILLKDASMGTDVDAKFLQSPNTINVGQRFFYLETDLTPGKVITHDSGVYYVLDCPQRFASMTFYLSETEAQKIAKHLREHNVKKAGDELVRVWLRIALRSVTRGLGDTVDIRHETIEIERALPAVLVRLAPVILRVLKWASFKFGPWFAKLLFDVVIAEQFIKIADDPKEGVTFKLIWRDPAGMGIVCSLLNKQGVSIADFAKEFKKLLTSLTNNIPTPQILAGYHRD